MEDYADIYYVDTRNADSRDHRTQTSSGWRPSSGPANSPSRPDSPAHQLPNNQVSSSAIAASRPMIGTSVRPPPSPCCTVVLK